MKKFFLAIPSMLTSLIAALPVLTCPLCWPLYAGVLSSMGLSFVNYTAYILPITAVMISISLFTLGWKAKKRRGFAPLFLGIFASLVLMIGKFYLINNYIFAIGAALLIGATVWNIYPKKNCTSCKLNKNLEEIL